MASKEWEGFSDEDIRRMQLMSTIKNKEDGSTNHCNGTPSTRRNKKHFIKNAKNQNCEPKSMKLKDVTDDNPEPSVNEGHGVDVGTLEEKNAKTNGNTESNDVKHASNSTEISVEQEVESTTVSDDTVQSKPDHQNLDAFQERQQRIETENAIRKALIIRVLTDKKKRTQAEAIKLTKIHKELSHLDSIVSADVSILRDYIESASMEFSVAEKRYLKAEKEFVEAKLLLFEKMQKKEQLTEHLCTIIEQNENRKANKLVEMMKELEMDHISDNCEEEIDPILSNMCTLHEEGYRHCQTIKASQSKKTSPCCEENEKCDSQTNEVNL